MLRQRTLVYRCLDRQLVAEVEEEDWMPAPQLDLYENVCACHHGHVQTCVIIHNFHIVV
jgi:hypothetical protein